MTSQTVAELHEQARQDYEAFKARGLKLDLTRGKPAPAQLDLSNELLTLPGEGVYKSADGTDLRNYGGLTGLRELSEIFAEGLQVPAERLLALGNASLTLMHDTVVHALLSGVPGGTGRWSDGERVAFLCPVPGYDRHFAICERFGIEMIQVPMTAEGPDMDVVERLVAEDATIKGIWCVPKYSNPSGISYSDEVVRRLARMRTAAPDFRVFWDNAYAVHHLTDKPAEILDVLAEAEAAGNPDRVFVYGSTSKVTFAGAGVAFFGSSEANIKWMTGFLGKSTIGPDKINQLRHVQFLKDAEGLAAHMRRHAEIVRPKFDAVDDILTRELGGTGLAEWTKPEGGYFISLDVPEGCAKRVVQLAKEAGVALTPAGATHPYGDDPADRTIRIAPTYPIPAELDVAIEGLATCVRLAGYEKQL
ncbi:aminotransferase class I/II-fold pyridoxal phosphate-dependent enzyme [Actinocorallia populi]|uniref:aminotransferase class I/II-fold pyridoxal phosphate-dependent enzyme n=1 Tax=Actinocorallia populi TaxID=2079200 RepID=UPI001E28BB35|nr:aminotransferase class I/II-fold pyridoxal phosphate-dependent enzyme [Actinocorallia populi]